MIEANKNETGSKTGRGRQAGARAGAIGMRVSFVLSAVALVAVALAAPLSARAQAEPIKGDPVRAKNKTAMCAGCHGIAMYRASYPEVFSVPLIGGQNERYLVAALEAYRKGDRAHPTMRAIAGSLTDEDIADLAAYYAQGGNTAVGRSN